MLALYVLTEHLTHLLVCDADVGKLCQSSDIWRRYLPVTATVATHLTSSMPGESETDQGMQSPGACRPSRQNMHHPPSCDFLAFYKCKQGSDTRLAWAGSGRFDAMQRGGRRS